MVIVTIGDEAANDIDALPMTMKARVAAVVAKLEGYPSVSGVKHLLHAWKGHLRVRTGDWRIIFTVSGDRLHIVRVAHRNEVYED